jgi:Methylase involved in ubiquinone/menaquinone biosynthesis
MDGLKLFFYREGEHFEYPGDVREACGEPLGIPLVSGGEGFATVDRPADADFLVFPYKLDPIIRHRRTAFTRRFLEELPHFAELEHRHVFFNCHDLGQPLCTRACIITDTPLRSNREDAFVQPYPFFPLAHVRQAAPDFNFSAIRFDVSFVGTISDGVRLALMEGIEREAGLRYYLNAPKAPDWQRSTSYLHMTSAARKQPLERLYTGVMRRSWATLCPRGRASSSFRFFETLCMGRLPVHVSDEYVLPQAESVDYGAFCLFLPEARAQSAGRLIRERLGDRDAAEREAMCRQARAAWEEHLAPEHAQRIALDILRRHRAVMPQGPARLVRSAPGCLKAEPPRRRYPTGYFAGMTLDDGRSWFGGAMLAQEGPEPGTVLVDGELGRFPRAALNVLYHAGRGLTANAAVVDLGCGAGVSSIVFANARISRRDLTARIFCVDQWEEGGLAAFQRNARRAGAEFLLTPMNLCGAEAAALFREDSLDLLFINRGQDAGALALWWDTLRPGGSVLCCHAAQPKAPVALRLFAARRGLAWEWSAGLGLFRVVKPATAALRVEESGAAGRGRAAG